MFEQGTVFKKLFQENMAILPILDNEKKNSMVIACKWNHYDFWNSRQRLQNFVNVEALS